MPGNRQTGIIKLHGREYKTVALRVGEFRAAHPIATGWAICTRLISADESVVSFRAAIVDPDNREIATGFAEEKRSARGINAVSALENCETSAIGRALSAAGFGGSEYCSADELAGAIRAQGKPAQAARQDERKAPADKPALRQVPTPINPAPKHHESFNRDAQRFFMARLGAHAIKYEDIATFCEGRGWGRPSTWAAGDRKKLLDELDAGQWDAWKIKNAQK